MVCFPKSLFSEVKVKVEGSILSYRSAPNCFFPRPRTAVFDSSLSSTSMPLGSLAPTPHFLRSGQKTVKSKR